MSESNKNLLTDTEKELLLAYLESEELFAVIMDRIEVAKEDDFFRAMLEGSLRRQAFDRLILLIWQNMTDEQAKHFKQFLDSMSVTDPDMPSDGLLIEFSMLYPDLKEKVFAGMTAFFDEFVEKANLSYN